MKIILGSSSPGRKLIMNELAKEHGFSFDIMSPDIDEKSIRHANPKQLVMAIANAKADALLSIIKEPAILICSDQVVLYKDEVREKPINEKEARSFMQDYVNGNPETLGAVVVVNTTTGKRASGIQTSKIYFKSLPDKIIDEHIKNGSAFRGAGGFQMHDPILRDHIDRIDGGYDSAAGLSKKLVKELVKKVSGDTVLKIS